MARLAAIALVLGLGAASAAAQPDPGGFGSPPLQHEEMRRPEVLTGRPSGFWTSTRPAVGGAYRWRMLAAGVVVLGISGLFLARALRRANVHSIRDGGPADGWQPSKPRR